MSVRKLSARLAAMPLVAIMTLAATATHAADNAVTDKTPRITVSGKNFVDGQGKTIQLRGANISGLEYIAVQGWSANDPSDNRYSAKVLDTLVSWKANVVRLPLNQASWLGYQCVDGLGKVVNPDPGRNYQDTVKKIVDRATSAGLYIIVDLHWTAPDDAARAVGNVKAMCPMGQNPMPDADHSEAFWTSIAKTFKDYPNVMFELFNEPFFDWKSGLKSDWSVLRDGGTFSGYVTGQGMEKNPWKAIGFQALINTVRQTGATNVLLLSGPDWAKRLDGWLLNKPTDPLKQIAAVWHAYSAWGTKWGTDAYTLPNYGNDAFTWVEDIVAANIPVIITEIGDRNANGTKGSPFVSKVLPWADRNNISYLGWTFNVWPDNSEHVLLKDVGGTPTDGYGQYFKQHLACVAGGKGNCP
ncbi:MAG: glycoside hydrolase family 5 protein [Steroidobacteraceae bacterium]